MFPLMSHNVKRYLILCFVNVNCLFILFLRKKLEHPETDLLGVVFLPCQAKSKAAKNVEFKINAQL